MRRSAQVGVLLGATVLGAATAYATPHLDCEARALVDVEAAQAWVSVDMDLLRVVPAVVDGGVSIDRACERIGAPRIAVLPGVDLGDGPSTAPPDPALPEVPRRDLPVAEPAPSPAHPAPAAHRDRLDCRAAPGRSGPAAWAAGLLLLGMAARRRGRR